MSLKSRRKAYQEKVPRLRAALKARDPWVCHYCGTSLAFTDEPSTYRETMVGGEVWQLGNWATIDHVVPLSRGGTDDLDNLVLACNVCNARKGARE